MRTSDVWHQQREISQTPDFCIKQKTLYSPYFEVILHRCTLIWSAPPPQALLIKSIFIKVQKMAPFLLAGMLQTPDTSHCLNKQRLKWEFILLRVREHEKCQRVKVFYIKVRFLPLCKSLIICDGKAARLPHSLSNCAQVMDAFQNQSR